MRRNFFVLLLVFFLTSVSDIFGMANAKCLGLSFEKLSNGISVVFISSEKNSDLLMLFCISSGSADEIEHRGVSNILTKIFTKKLQENSKSLGIECNSYAGFDQSVYYIFGKVDTMEEQIKSFSSVYYSFSASEEEVSEQRQSIEKSLELAKQQDKKLMRSTSRKSLYLHSQYGFDIEGDVRNLNEISADHVNNFKKNHYMTTQLTVVIVGSPDKKSTLAILEKNFVKDNATLQRNRLQEPPHHGSTTTLVKKSSQINVPVMEMYWKVPNYFENKEKALACDIFINILDQILSKKLIDELKLAASISFRYSFWNREYGDFCIIVVPKDSSKLNLLKTAICSELRYVAHKGINEKEAEEASKKLSESANYLKKDLFDIADVFSKRLSSGYDYEFVKNFATFSRKYKLEDVNKNIKEFFDKSPCVISEVLPAIENERKNVL